MKNKEFSDRFESLRETHISRLIWIAASIENSEDLAEMLEDLSNENWKNLFPEIHDSEYFEEFKSEPIEALIDFEKLGFLAEIHIPICRDFSFDENGDVDGYTSSPGYCRIEYAYAETIEELMAEIEKKADQLFQEFIETAKSNPKITS